MAKILASDNTEHKTLKAAQAYERKLVVIETALTKVPEGDQEAVRNAIANGVVKVAVEPKPRKPRTKKEKVAE